MRGACGAQVRLEKGRRYRVIGVYDDPTDATLVNGAMAHIVGVSHP